MLGPCAVRFVFVGRNLSLVSSSLYMLLFCLLLHIVKCCLSDDYDERKNIVFCQGNNAIIKS